MAGVVNPRTAIADLMQADGALMALLTGGVYRVAQLTPGMDAPTPFDAVSGVMRPSALVRNETTATDGPAGHFDRAFVVVFFYDHGSYTVIDDALDRTREILHRRYVGNGAYEIRHIDDVSDQYDDALLAYMHRSRYQVVRYRG